MQVRATIAAALASALLLWAAAPSLGLGWLAWLALVPAAAVSLRAPATRSARVAVPLAYALHLELLLVPSFPFGLAEDQWGDPVVPILVGNSPVVFIALVVVPLAGLALYALRFPQPFRLDRAPALVAGLGSVLVPALVWTAFDFLRARFDPGAFWGPLYLSQHDTEAGRLATLGGPWLVTFALVACNYTLAFALVRGRAARPVVAIVAGAAVALVAAVAATGQAGGRSTAVVAAIQPGYDTAEFERPVLHYLRRRTRDLERASLDLIGDLAPLTREAAAHGARIAVWPEAAVWVDPSENAPVERALSRLARETRLVLVVPYFLRAQAHGATVAVLPDGTITRPQPKQRPMWFLGEKGGNRAPAAPVAAGGSRIGTLLGVDNEDPARARLLVARGATLIASSTHDWTELAPAQRALARVHAVALGVPVARADWRYGSAVFDANGRKVADAGLAKRRAAVVAEVRAPVGATPYAGSGDALGWAALALLACLSLAGAARGFLQAASERTLSAPRTR